MSHLKYSPALSEAITSAALAASFPGFKQWIFPYSEPSVLAVMPQTLKDADRSRAQNNQGYGQFKGTK